MKRFLVPAAFGLCILLGACADPAPPKLPPHKPGFNPPHSMPPPEPDDTTTEPDRPSHQETPPPPEPTPPPAPVPNDAPKVGELPYGKSVPGKTGYVTSPYEPYRGYIDVRGYPPGTEVKDPFTGKTFLVP